MVSVQAAAWRLLRGHSRIWMAAAGIVPQLSRTPITERPTAAVVSKTLACGGGGLLVQDSGGGRRARRQHKAQVPLILLAGNVHQPLRPVAALMQTLRRAT